MPFLQCPAGTSLASACACCLLCFQHTSGLAPASLLLLFSNREIHEQEKVINKPSLLLEASVASTNSDFDWRAFREVEGSG